MNIFCGLLVKKTKLSNGRMADSQCDGLVSVIANTDMAELQQMLMDMLGEKLFSLELLTAMHGLPRSMCSTFDYNWAKYGLRGCNTVQN